MWRITSFFKRQSTLSRAHAVSLWHDTIFEPMAAVARQEGALCAIANLPFDPPAPGLPDLFDAVAELWFGDLESARSALARVKRIRHGVEWLAVADQTSPSPWIGEVRAVLDRGELGIKVIRAGRPAAGVDASDALAYWRDHHPVVAQTATQFWSLLRRYTQVPALDPLDPQSYPLQADVGAASPEDMAAAFAHDEYFAIVQPDERRFSLAGQLVSERLYFAGAREWVAYDDRPSAGSGRL
jgi:hypothetical protein